MIDSVWSSRRGIFLSLMLMLCGCTGCAAVACAAVSEGPVEYTITLDAPRTQMVDISMMIRDVSGASLEVALPVWRPGKYLVLDPAGAVRDVRATGGSGESLPIEKLDKSRWRIETRGASDIRIDYRIYANSLDDRTRHVDETHAFLSGSAVFMYAPDRRDDPVRVSVGLPAGWRIASGLEFAEGSETTLVAPNYDVLVDSPLEIGLHDRIEFEAGGKAHEIIIWSPVPGRKTRPDYNDERLITDFTTIIEAQRDIFGDLPYERYVFIIHAGGGGRGGTEHLNSTIVQTATSALEASTERSSDAWRRFLGLVSHEFFHTWNVKQLRPAGIHPYDYQRENYSRLFWVAEGTTSYYDDLTLARTGLMALGKYFEILGNAIDGDRRRPGSRAQSLEESSFDAWIKFNRSTPDDVNSTVSFYTKGALVSLLLDMELRRLTEGRMSLDDVMRAMYERFPLSGPGYTPQNLIDVVEELGECEFDSFFDAFVRGVAPPDYERALEVVGLEVYFKPTRRASTPGANRGTEDTEERGDEDEEADEGGDNGAVPERAYLGVNLSGTTVRSVLSDGPAFAAGVIPGDELLAIDERRLSSGRLDDLITEYQPGEQITITLFRREALRQITITLGAEPDGKWTVRRVKEPTDAQMAAYESWLGQKWPDEGS